jgi:hypothetical protein
MVNTMQESFDGDLDAALGAALCRAETAERKWHEYRACAERYLFLRDHAGAAWASWVDTSDSGPEHRKDSEIDAAILEMRRKGTWGTLKDSSDETVGARLGTLREASDLCEANAKFLEDMRAPDLGHVIRALRQQARRFEAMSQELAHPAFYDPRQGTGAPVAGEAQRSVAWENFPAYLIDHCEGDTISEEGLQRALSRMLADPKYAAPQASEAQQPALAVWYGSMPESNGKSNWTAILHRKGEGLMDGPHITIDRSEYPDRVRYEADRMRYLIGEIADEPCILDYDADKCDAAPQANTQPIVIDERGGT